jgi:hypothetical protein
MVLWWQWCKSVSECGGAVQARSAGLERADARAVCLVRSLLCFVLALSCGVCRCRWGYEVMEVTKAISASIPSIRFPFLMLQGTADRLVDPAGARTFYERAASN